MPEDDDAGSPQKDELYKGHASPDKVDKQPSMNSMESPMQPIPVKNLEPGNNKYLDDQTMGMSFEDEGTALRAKIPAASEQNIVGTSRVGKVSVRSEPEKELSFKKSEQDGSQKPETLQPQDQDNKEEQKVESTPVAEETKEENKELDLIVEDLTTAQIKANLVKQRKEAKKKEDGDEEDV